MFGLLGSPDDFLVHIQAKVLMFSLKSLIIVLVLMWSFWGSKRPTPPFFEDKVLMIASNDFTQNYSLQNKRSLKQTNKELLNCRFELIPLKNNCQ